MKICICKPAKIQHSTATGLLSLSKSLQFYPEGFFFFLKQNEIRQGSVLSLRTPKVLDASGTYYISILQVQVKGQYAIPLFIDLAG